MGVCMLGVSGVTQRSVLTRFQKKKYEKIVKKVGRKERILDKKAYPPSKRDLAIYGPKPILLTGGVYGNKGIFCRRCITFVS